MPVTHLPKAFVTIVSGLPRSGTSMMMRMLEVGGIPLLTDNVRQADEDNPAGYYEFEPVKQTRSDASWVDTARGKAVKMVYRLLYDLPPAYEYRVLFMRRHLDEVLASQRIMLERSGKTDTSVSDEQMAALFRSQLERFEQWVRAQKNIALLDVRYNELLARPRAGLDQINEFLGGGLDVLAMETVVDHSLYRNRS